jgi:hypothetical protein
MALATLAAQEAAADPEWCAEAPGAELIGGLRAILPLVLFLAIVMKFLLRERVPHAAIVVNGIVLALLGMMIFNLGLTFGLAKLGSQSGSIVPSAFAALENVTGSPLYPYVLGVSVALLFAWILGFGATLAEPALNALGMTVESLTNGAFRKQMLMYAVSTGVGFGIAKITFELPLGWLLLPLYGIGVVLTVLSLEEFVNIAWDSAGVTTGPVTVPLVLTMGLGFGGAVDVVEGFGILSMASICPIIAVLTLGLVLKRRVNRHAQEVAQTEVSS